MVFSNWVHIKIMSPSLLFVLNLFVTFIPHNRTLDQSCRKIFTSHINNNILFIQKYVNDIIFDSTNDDLFQEFSKTIRVNLK